MNTKPPHPSPAILIIDDDPTATRLYDKLLTSRGYQVTTTHSSKEGLERVRDNGLDLVILDLLMPEMHGWQVCREIKKINPLPILIISAIDSPDVKIKTLDLGADDYLTKPITVNVLFARLNMLIRRYHFEKFAHLLQAEP